MFLHYEVPHLWHLCGLRLAICSRRPRSILKHESRLSGRDVHVINLQDLSSIARRSQNDHGYQTPLLERSSILFESRSYPALDASIEAVVLSTGICRIWLGTPPVYAASNLPLMLTVSSASGCGRHTNGKTIPCSSSSLLAWFKPRDKLAPTCRHLVKLELQIGGRVNV
jgi:hypothetical protein